MANSQRPESYHRLEIHIRRGSGSEFLLSASGSVFTHNPNARTEIDLAGPELGGYLARLEAGEADDELFRHLGSLLFDLLFSGNIKTAYETSLQDADHHRKDGVRIILNLTPDASALYELPWMLLYDGERQWRLGGFDAPLHRRTPLAFSVEGARALPPVDRSPLRILVVGASPADLEVIDVDAEVRAIRKALAARVTDGSIAIDVLASAEGKPVTRSRVVERIRSLGPHVLHFICHGPLSRAEAEKPVLYLEFEDGAPHPYPVDALHAAIQVAGATVRFAVLNACNSDGAARFLARQGMPAIGTAAPIRGHAAEPFSRGLYQAIAAGVPMDEAVNRAREEIRQEQQPREMDWVSPVVYLPFGEVIRLLARPREVDDGQPPPPPRRRVEALATLSVSSEPSGAEVEVNGARRGRTPLDFQVTPGNYRVEVRKSGTLARPRTQTTSVGAGSTAILHFRLLPLRWLWLLPLLVVLFVAGGLVVQHFWTTWTRVPAGMARLPAGSFLKGGEETPLVSLVRKYANLLDLDLILEPEPAQGRIVRAYWIDRHEVTNESYGRFLDSLAEIGGRHAQLHPDEPAGHNHTPSKWGEPAFDGPDQPVVGVDFHDAAAYCRWAGKRLPTADEWERAARGTDGRLYPWGDEFEATAASTGEAPEQAPVAGGTYPKDRSPEGVFDLGGNVAEWTATPVEFAGQDSRRVAGGSWLQPGEVYSLTFLSRAATKAVRQSDLGFRCTADAVAGREPPAEMVPIPAGPFLQGGEDSAALDLARRFNLGSDALSRVLGEAPTRARGREVLLDRHEVTNEDYRRLMNRSVPGAGEAPDGSTHPIREPAGWSDPDFSGPRQPVVGVDWSEAAAYCRWAGKRLPTDEEWERAIRGQEGRRYPWGDEFEPGRCQTSEAPERPKATVPVGSLPGCVSPEGLFDLVGNADEWTADVAEGADGGESRLIRGGGWSDPGRLRGLGWVKAPAGADYRGKDIGFRCAADPRPSWLEALWRRWGPGREEV